MIAQLRYFIVCLAWCHCITDDLIYNYIINKTAGLFTEIHCITDDLIYNKQDCWSVHRDPTVYFMINI